MPDEVTHNTPDTTTDDITKDVEVTDETETVSKEQYQKVVANSRKWENYAKSNVEYKEKFEALQNEKQTTNQTLEDRIKTLEAENASVKDEAEKTKVSALRTKIAADNNLPTELASILDAYTTEEDIKAKAEVLAKAVAPQKQQSSGISSLFTQGSGGNGDHAKESSLDSFIEDLINKTNQG